MQYAEIIDGRVAQIIETNTVMPAHKLRPDLLPVVDQTAAKDEGQDFGATIYVIEADRVVRTQSVTVIPIGEARTRKLAELAELRWLKTQTMVWDGVVTPASPAISALTGAVVAIQTRVPPPTVEWKLGPGEWRTYDLAQLIALGSAMRDHIQACFSREAVLDAQIQAAATSREVMAIDLTAGWPATTLAEVGG